jgi:hypothetical protein
MGNICGSASASATVVLLSAAEYSGWLVVGVFQTTAAAALRLLFHFRSASRIFLFVISRFSSHATQVAPPFSSVIRSSQAVYSGLACHAIPFALNYAAAALALR